MSLKLCSSKIVFMPPLCRGAHQGNEGLWHAISKLSVAHPNLNFLEKSIRPVGWLSGNWITSITSIPQLWFGSGVYLGFCHTESKSSAWIQANISCRYLLLCDLEQWSYHTWNSCPCFFLGFITMHADSFPSGNWSHPKSMQMRSATIKEQISPFLYGFDHTLMKGLEQ